MSEIQAVLFGINSWTIPEARYWLNEHNLIPIKDAHITKKYIHFRIRNPKIFRRIRTIKTSDDLDLIIGFK